MSERAKVLVARPILEGPTRVLPHRGSVAVDTRDAMGRLAVRNAFAALDGERPPPLLNPDVLGG